MTKLNHLLLGFVLGAAVSYGAAKYFFESSDATSQTTKKPLYWVAPMDSNYRRDQPGLSPMGMALVPVYDTTEANPGVVKITANVINNLGVKTTAVEAQRLQKNVRAVGYIEYNEQFLSHVHPRVSGWVHQLFVKTDGIQVQAGDPLFALYSPELINAQEEYLLALARQQTSLIQATEARLRSLQINETIIQQIKSSQTALQYIVFYAPQSGVVSNLNVREGFYLQPGTEVMTLADLSSVWLTIELTEQQLSWVQLGDQVRMQTNALPGEVFSGQLDFIDPFLDPKSKTVQARLTLSNQHRRLKPHMIADVSIQTQGSDEVLTVPRSAVIRTGQQDRVVWALGAGEFKSVAVELGRSNDQYFEILAGLNAGDEVVTAAQFLLDSESHKSSDLDRYSHIAEPSSADTAEPPSARVKGTLLAINGPVLTIDREAIEKWQRPATTMDFNYPADVRDLQPGQRLDFTFAVQKDAFVITEIHASWEPGHDQ